MVDSNWADFLNNRSITEVKIRKKRGWRRALLHSTALTAPSYSSRQKWRCMWMIYYESVCMCCKKNFKILEGSLKYQKYKWTWMAASPARTAIRRFTWRHVDICSVSSIKPHTMGKPHSTCCEAFCLVFIRLSAIDWNNGTINEVCLVG